MDESAGLDTNAALGDDEQTRRRHLIRDLFPTTPYMSSIGVVVERFEPDDVVLRIPFRPDLTNDGTAYHGGVIASLLDSTGGLAAWSNHDFRRGTAAATLSMSVQYVGVATAGSDLWCAGSVSRRARELIFATMRAFDAADRTVADGHLVYRIT